MKRLKFLIFTGLALMVATFSLEINWGFAQQEPDAAIQVPKKLRKLEKAQEETAAARRYYGLQRNTTDAERRAAAQRNAERQAAADQGTEGGTR